MMRADDIALNDVVMVVEAGIVPTLHEGGVVAVSGHGVMIQCEGFRTIVPSEDVRIGHEGFVEVLIATQIGVIVEDLRADKGARLAA